MAERAFIAGPTVIGGGGFASSFQYLLTGAEQLRLTVYGEQQGTYTARAILSTRVWRKSDGSITVQTHDLDAGNPSSVGTSADFPLTEGALLNARLAIDTAAIPLGIRFGRLQLIYGSGPGAIVIGTLLQGYFNRANELAWPGTPLESMHAGLGAAWTFLNDGATVPLRQRVQPPTNCRLVVDAISCQFTASAVVAARSLLCSIYEPSGDRAWVSGAVVPVNAGGVVILSAGIGLPAANPGGVTRVEFSLPSRVELTGGMRLEFEAFNDQVGDAFGSMGGAGRLWLDAP